MTRSQSVVGTKLAFNVNRNAHSSEYTPENFRPLSTKPSVKVERLKSSWSLISCLPPKQWRLYTVNWHVGSDDGMRPKRFRRIDHSFQQQTSEAIANKLGREQGEDSNASVHVVVVEQLLHGDNLYSRGGCGSGTAHNDGLIARPISYWFICQRFATIPPLTAACLLIS